jgi:hypothetical protein
LIISMSIGCDAPARLIVFSSGPIIAEFHPTPELPLSSKLPGTAHSGNA